MNTKVKKKWIKALRSGVYKQGRGSLKRVYGGDKPTYCCLGVLCDLYLKEHPRSRAKWVDDYNCDFVSPNGISTASIAPELVAKWAGIYPLNKEMDDPQNKLITLNDTKKYTFKSIANYIEKNL